MDIDLRDLELLEALETNQTLTASAQKLYVSQPALSQRLVRLEQRLGTPLFDRTGRRLIVTPAGKRMLQAARVALHELRSAVRDVHQLKADHDETLRIWSQCSTNYHWLPDILRLFRQEWPGADVAIETIPDSEHIEALLDGRIDIALITKLRPQLDQVRLHRLFDDELLAVVNADHSWVGKPYVTAADFSDVHLVLFDSYDPSRIPPVPLPIPPGATPGQLSTLPMLTDALIDTVINTDTVTVLPSWIAAPYLTTGSVRTVQVGATPQSRTWYCATRHEPLPRHLAAFVDLLSDELQKNAPTPAHGAFGR